MVHSTVPATTHPKPPLIPHKWYNTYYMRERYDGALVHIYGYEERGNDKHARVSIRSKLVLEAARELMKSSQVENFVFASRPALGEKEPMSTVTANEFIHMTHVDPKHVFVNPSAPATTNQELKFLRMTAEKHHWSQVVSVGCELHKRTITTLAERIFKDGIDFEFKSAEEILQTYPSPQDQQRYQKIIDALHNSEGEKKFARYESGLANKFKLHFPFGPEILDVVARFYRPKVD